MIRRVRRFLARFTCLKSAYRATIAGLTPVVYRVSPALLAKLRYRAAWAVWPDLRNPRRFDEKLLWLMLNDSDPVKTRCADKYEMRTYVEEQGLGDILPRLLGVYESAADIDFNALPEKFALKCTHGCKCNVFCKNRKDLNPEDARRKLHEWMQIDFSSLSGERHYGDMKRRIIAEELLEEPGAVLPTDYKVHCLNGKPTATMICTERNPNGVPKLQFFDRDWKRTLPYIVSEFRASLEVPRPAGYDRMIQIAEKLARPFPFVRVDFYCLQDRILLGELTFTPGGCVSADYLTEAAQVELGEPIVLPRRNGYQ